MVFILSLLNLKPSKFRVTSREGSVLQLSLPCLFHQHHHVLELKHKLHKLVPLTLLGLLRVLLSQQAHRRLIVCE
jgi:hypothetical protein